MWSRNDPRETFSFGNIVVYTNEEVFLAYYDGDHDGCWYIHTNSKYEKYRRISPGAEVKEWPGHWLWAHIPDVVLKENGIWES